MTHTIHHQKPLLACLFVFAWSLLVSAQQATQQQKAEKGPHMGTQQLQIAKEEMLRRHKVKQQRGQFEFARDYIKALHQRTIEGNRNDYEKNKAFYERYAAQARELRQKDEEEKAQMVEAVANLYREAALANREIVMAFAENDPRLGKVLEENFDKITKLERQFREIAKSEMKRSWITNDEYTAYIKAYHQRAEKR